MSLRLHQLPFAAALMTALALAPAAQAQGTRAADAATLTIDWPTNGSTVTLGSNPEKAIALLVSSNFLLKPAGQCGADPRCGHVHLKIDPDGDSCNQPAKAYNSMNSDFGGPMIAARLGYCPSPTGSHVIGVLLANDHHQPVLVNGKPVTALVTIKAQ